MNLRRRFLKCRFGFESVKDRDIRIGLYSAFVGGALTVVVVFSFISHHEKRMARHCVARKQEISSNTACRPCPAVHCPLVSDGRVKLSRDIMDFVDDHMEIQRNSPLIVIWTRLKSTPNYYLSLPPPEHDMTISHAIITRGGWNEDVISMFCHWMSTAPEEAYFVDVGAYVGTMTIGVAACGYSVFAFEPHAANFNFLQESIALNPSYSSQIWSYQKALGNTTGTTCVSASSSDQSNARIVPGTSVDYQCPQGIVPITTLDEVTKHFQIWAINIDVQGFDPAVIAGAWKHVSGKTPPRYIRFKVETGMYNWQTLNTELNLEDILRGMQDLGYSLRDEDNDIVVNVKQHLLNVGHFATYMTAVFHGRPEGRNGGER